MKKIDLFDKYTTPESWKDAVRSGVRQEKEKKRYSLSFLPSLQTVLAVVIICVVVGFVAKGGIVNLINTTKDDNSENNGYTPNAGFVGNNAHSTVATKDMTEEELKYAYKAYSDSFGITETEGGYQRFVSEINRELPDNQQVVITCGLDKAICKRTNIIYTSEDGSIPLGTGKDNYYAVIIVPIVFDDGSVVDVEYFNTYYKLHNNGALVDYYSSAIDSNMKLNFVKYEELPNVMFAVCKMSEYDASGKSKKPLYIQDTIEAEKEVPVEYVAGYFTRDEVNDIYKNGTNLTCSCGHGECTHFKVKEHEELVFGISFITEITED